MPSKEVRVYDVIDKKAGSNIAMQGLTGIMGFPFTTIGDVAVFFTHYGPMLNEIRGIYGREQVSSDYIKPILSGCKNELLTDMMLDKFLGNIPLLGLPANMLCAKAMTWRLGILFGMLASRGEEINLENVQSAVRLIREMFPQRDSLLFRKPSVTVTVKLLKAVEGDTFEGFENKMSRILDEIAAV